MKLFYILLVFGFFQVVLYGCSGFVSPSIGGSDGIEETSNDRNNDGDGNSGSNEGSDNLLNEGIGDGNGGTGNTNSNSNNNNYHVGNPETQAELDYLNNRKRPLTTAELNAQWEADQKAKAKAWDLRDYPAGYPATTWEEKYYQDFSHHHPVVKNSWSLSERDDVAERRYKMREIEGRYYNAGRSTREIRADSEYIQLQQELEDFLIDGIPFP